ncbi:MAG: hypothetical protein ABI333_02195 [bacterium]
MKRPLCQALSITVQRLPRVAAPRHIILLGLLVNAAGCRTGPSAPATAHRARSRPGLDADRAAALARCLRSGHDADGQLGDPHTPEWVIGSPRFRAVLTALDDEDRAAAAAVRLAAQEQLRARGWREARLCLSRVRQHQVTLRTRRAQQVRRWEEGRAREAAATSAALKTGAADQAQAAALLLKRGDLELERSWMRARGALRRLEAQRWAHSTSERRSSGREAPVGRTGAGPRPREPGSPPAGLRRAIDSYRLVLKQYPREPAAGRARLHLGLSLWVASVVQLLHAFDERDRKMRLLAPVIMPVSPALAVTGLMTGLDPGRVRLEGLGLPWYPGAGRLVSPTWPPLKRSPRESGSAFSKQAAALAREAIDALHPLLCAGRPGPWTPSGAPVPPAGFLYAPGTDVERRTQRATGRPRLAPRKRPRLAPNPLAGYDPLRACRPAAAAPRSSGSNRAFTGPERHLAWLVVGVAFTWLDTAGMISSADRQRLTERLKKYWKRIRARSPTERRRQLAIRTSELLAEMQGNVSQVLFRYAFSALRQAQRSGSPLAIARAARYQLGHAWFRSTPGRFVTSDVDELDERPPTVAPLPDSLDRGAMALLRLLPSIRHPRWRRAVAQQGALAAMFSEGVHPSKWLAQRLARARGTSARVSGAGRPASPVAEARDSLETRRALADLWFRNSLPPPDAPEPENCEAESLVKALAIYRSMLAHEGDRFNASQGAQGPPPDRGLAAAQIHAIEILDLLAKNADPRVRAAYPHASGLAERRAAAKRFLTAPGRTPSGLARVFWKHWGSDPVVARQLKFLRKQVAGKQARGKLARTPAK